MSILLALVSSKSKGLGLLILYILFSLINFWEIEFFSFYMYWASLSYFWRWFHGLISFCLSFLNVVVSLRWGGGAGRRELHTGKFGDQQGSPGVQLVTDGAVCQEATGPRRKHRKDWKEWSVGLTAEQPEWKPPNSGSTNYRNHGNLASVVGEEETLTD